MRLLLSLLLLSACATSAPPPSPTRDYDVAVTRDAWGVPTIRGARDADVAYGVGLAHAEDDFATIQRQLLAVRRRLGRVDGRTGAEADFLSHVLRVQEVVAALYETDLSDAERAMMEGYADALNAFAAAHPDEVLDRSLFPTTGRDVVGGFVLTQPLFFGLGRVIGPLASGGDLPLPPAQSEFTRGSNAFAVAPSRDLEGRTRLISNSHQPWSGPVAWYELQVESGEGWRFRGVNFPGTPFPLMGHNEHLGYTNTVNRPDLIDVYELAMAEEGDRNRYRFGDEWLELERERIFLRVKTGPVSVPVPRTLYRSVHGPVFKTENGVFAVRWPGMENVRQASAYPALARARNLGEFEAALRMQAIPSTNFVYADREGNIAYYYNAMFPDRAPGFDYWDVLPGDDPAALWDGLAPWEATPRVVNPEAGWLMNANNTPFLSTGETDELNPDDFAPELGIEPYLTNRGLRAARLLRGIEGPIKDEALMTVKFDRAYERDSPPAILLARAAAVASDDPLVREAADLLKGWDYTADGIGDADTLAGLVMKANRPAAYGAVPPPDPEETLRAAASYLMEHHGRLDVPLPEALRLRHGSADLPLTGGYDTLRAIGWTNEADGTMVADFGDSYIAVIEWDAEGNVSSRSVQPFGAAVDDPQSPHHTDQSVLFSEERFKEAGF